METQVRKIGWKLRSPVVQPPRMHDYLRVLPRAQGFRWRDPSLELMGTASRPAFAVLGQSMFRVLRSTESEGAWRGVTLYVTEQGWKAE